MSRIDYTISRASIGASLMIPDPHLVAKNQMIWTRGVRNGFGLQIMPTVTQLFKDNYFNNQTLDAALDSPWTGNNDVVRDENTLIGYSVELDGSSTDADIYLVYQTEDVCTMSAFVYAPPPFRLDALEVYTGDTTTTAQPDGIVSLGNYWYFIWSTDTGQNNAADRWGVIVDNTESPVSSIWVSCMSLTATAAPVGFIPNNSTTAIQASQDDNIKFALDEPLPQAGTITFVYIPFYDNDGSAIDADPVIVSFFPTSGTRGGDDYMVFQIDDNASHGLYGSKKVSGGSAEETSSTGFAGTGFSAFQPIEIAITWDFTRNGTKLVNIWVNGKHEVSSPDWDEGMPNNLVDMWVGGERSGASTWQQHSHGIIQDLQIWSKS